MDQAPIRELNSRMVFLPQIDQVDYGGYWFYTFLHFVEKNCVSAPKFFGPEMNFRLLMSLDYIDSAPLFWKFSIIFSSNRPGGLVGFDLYYVGFRKFWFPSWCRPAGAFLDIFRLNCTATKLVGPWADFSKFISGAVLFGGSFCC